VQRQFAIPVFTAVALTLCVLAAAFAQVSPSASAARRSVSQPPSSQLQPPSPSEMKARTDLLIANQHANDEALLQYEHILREIDRTGGSNPRTLEDKTFRVVPTGTGTLRILLRDNGRPTDPAYYRRQLQAWKDVLELALRPDDPRARTAYAKYEKRNRERAQLVNATREAYLQKWVGRETILGHDCDVIELKPNPDFRPHSMLQEVLTHFTAKVWVDHNANQLVRGEAHVIRDISIGGGILGKLYRGGVFSFEQAPVSENIWLPTRYQYDFTGRKFLFTFEVHQVVQSSQYRRVGPPKEALAVVRNEIASGKVVQVDP
jgi:hypothetical protein